MRRPTVLCLSLQLVPSRHDTQPNDIQHDATRHYDIKCCVCCYTKCLGAAFIIIVKPSLGSSYQNDIIFSSSLTMLQYKLTRLSMVNLLRLFFGKSKTHPQNEVHDIEVGYSLTGMKRACQGRTFQIILPLGDKPFVPLTLILY